MDKTSPSALKSKQKVSDGFVGQHEDSPTSQPLKASAPLDLSGQRLSGDPAEGGDEFTYASSTVKIATETIQRYYRGFQSRKTTGINRRTILDCLQKKQSNRDRESQIIQTELTINHNEQDLYTNTEVPSVEAASTPQSDDFPTNTALSSDDNDAVNHSNDSFELQQEEERSGVDSETPSSEESEAVAPPPIITENFSTDSNESDGRVLEQTSSPELSIPKPQKSTIDQAQLVHRAMQNFFHHPFEGGYHHVRSHQVFFHASTQTPRAEDLKRMMAQQRFHRETQTIFVRHRLHQNPIEQGTQMPRVDLIQNTSTDRVIHARSFYVTADEYLAKRVRATIQLQCFFRKLKAARFVDSLRQQSRMHQAQFLTKAERRNYLLEQQRKNRLESRLHPKTSKDFANLFSGLEKWRAMETLKINEAHRNDDKIRLVKLAELLNQEASLIQKIDLLKVSANEWTRVNRIHHILNVTSSPKKWLSGKKNASVSMFTPGITRARELKELYLALSKHVDNGDEAGGDRSKAVDDRLQVLLHVKYTVKEFDCRLSRDIVELIDREGDLLSRGRSAESLRGLRHRLSNLFFNFIQTPEFNPEAAQFSKLPVTIVAERGGDGSSMDSSDAADVSDSTIHSPASTTSADSIQRGQKRIVLPGFASTAHLYQCKSCFRYIPSTQFSLTNTMKMLGRCKACVIQENIAFKRRQLEGPHRMMANICVDEARRMNEIKRLWDRCNDTMAKWVYKHQQNDTKLFHTHRNLTTKTWACDDAKLLLRAALNVYEHFFTRALAGYGMSGDMVFEGDGATLVGSVSLLNPSTHEQLVRLALDGGEHAFMTLMTEADISYIVESLWGGQSAIDVTRKVQKNKSSEDADFEKKSVDYDMLVLTRWDALMPLSPWNCILLRRTEADAHDRHCTAISVQNLITRIHQRIVDGPGSMDDDFAITSDIFSDHATPGIDSTTLTQLYAPEFIRIVSARHLAAKTHFERLPIMEKYLLEKLLQSHENTSNQKLHQNASTKTLQLPQLSEVQSSINAPNSRLGDFTSAPSTPPQPIKLTSGL